MLGLKLSSFSVPNKMDVLVAEETPAVGRSDSEIKESMIAKLVANYWSALAVTNTAPERCRLWVRCGYKLYKIINKEVPSEHWHYEETARAHIGSCP